MHTPIAVRLRCCQAAILLALIFSRSAAADPQVTGQRAPAARPARIPADVRAERYSIDVTFEPDRGFLRARASVTLVTDQILKAIEIELNPRLAIKSVQDAKNRALQFDRSDRMGSPKVSVRLAEPSRPGERFELTFAYEGVLPRGMLDYITKDGILLRDESRWYPAVDLSAFTQNDIRITLPDGWRGVSIGDPEVDGASDKSVTWRWKTSHPVSSRSVVALPFTGVEAMLVSGISGLPQVHLNLLARPGLEKEQSLLLTRIEKMISHDGMRLENYQGNRLTIVEGFPEARGAMGYSAPGFLVVSRDVMKYADEAEYAPAFLPHELAHQWFPIDVTIEREEDGWLAESIAE